MTTLQQCVALAASINSFRNTSNIDHLKNELATSISMLCDSLDNTDSALKMDDSLVVTELVEQNRYTTSSSNFVALNSALLEIGYMCDTLPQDLQLLYYSCLYGVSMLNNNTETAYLEKAKGISIKLNDAKELTPKLSFGEKLAYFSHTNPPLVWTVIGIAGVCALSGSLNVISTILIAAALTLFFGKTSYQSKHKHSIKIKMAQTKKHEHNKHIIETIQRNLNS